MTSSSFSRQRQCGAVTVEFALSFLVFWIAFMGVVEFSRLMFVWGTAAEATQMGARLARICELGVVQEERIRQKVAHFVQASGQVNIAGRSDWLAFTYIPAGCTNSTCEQVEVALNNVQAHLLMPLAVTEVPLPSFRTRELRETMDNSLGNEANDACD